MLLILPKQLLHAQNRGFVLGGGHTNYSDRKVDRHGLRTGVYADVHHLFGFYLNGAYAAYTSTMPNVSLKPGGMGFGGGICYELQYYYFKFQIGMGVEWEKVKNTVADTIIIDDIVRDARGYPYTLRYDFFSRKDMAWDWHVQLPILFGSAYAGAYFLAGFKLDYALHWGATRVSATGSTSGVYPQYLGLFWEMDNHGMRKNVPIERHGKSLEQRFDILASLEIGYEFGTELSLRSKYKPANKNKWRERYESRFRIAAFADYGLLNTMPKMNNADIEIPANYKWDFPEFRFEHVFSSARAKQYQLHNLYAGIRLTVLFGTYFDYKCHLCSPFETERDMANPYIPRKRVRHTGTGR